MADPQLEQREPKRAHTRPTDRRVCRTDLDIRRDILEEIEWDRRLDASGIRVSVSDGIATLSGRVTVYADKFEAENAAKRIRGVRAIANDIEVYPVGPSQWPDTDIAQAALSSLKWDAKVPEQAIQVTVRDGWITLDGCVENHHQKEAADRAVRQLIGARGVINSILVRPGNGTGDIKRMIEAALRRNANVESDRVRIEVVGQTVILSGELRSWAEREEVERVAWNAPGVTNLENRITICPETKHIAV